MQRPKQIRKRNEQKENMNKLREEKAKAELTAKRAEIAEKRAKTTETSEHNTEYRATPSTPDNRAKPKAKTGPSPKKSPGTLPPVPPKPTGEKAPGSQDNPESTHESKGKRCRPRNTQGPPPIKKR